MTLINSLPSLRSRIGDVARQRRRDFSTFAMLVPIDKCDKIRRLAVRVAYPERSVSSHPKHQQKLTYDCLNHDYARPLRLISHRGRLPGAYQVAGLLLPGHALRHCNNSATLTLANPCPWSSMPIPRSTSSSKNPVFFDIASSPFRPQA